MQPLLSFKSDYIQFVMRRRYRIQTVCGTLFLNSRKLCVILCITNPRERALKIAGFKWDEGNTLHLELGHGIEPAEAEEVFAVGPLFRRTKRGHYAAMGPTLGGRYLTLVFEVMKKGMARVITGWDMSDAEKRYYLRHRRR